MPRNGSGTYELPSPPTPFQNGTVADANEVMATLEDMGDALTGSLSADGQTQATGPQNFGGNRLDGLASFQSYNGAMSARDGFLGRAINAGTASLSTNTYTATIPTMSPPGLDNGATVRFRASAPNPSPAPRLRIGALTDYEMVFANGATIPAGYIQTGMMCEAVFVAADDKWLLVNSPTDIVAITTVSAPVSSVDFTLPAGVRVIEVIIDKLAVENDTGFVGLRVSVDGGANFIATTSYLSSAVYVGSTGAIAGARSTNSVASIFGDAIAAAPISGVVRLFPSAAGGLQGGFDAYMAPIYNGGSPYRRQYMSSFHIDPGSTVNAIRFTGNVNMTAGRFVLRKVA